MPYVEVINLSDNPVCQKSNFREKVRSRLLSVRFAASLSPKVRCYFFSFLQLFDADKIACVQVIATNASLTLRELNKMEISIEERLKASTRFHLSSLFVFCSFVSPFACLWHNAEFSFCTPGTCQFR